MQLVSDAGFTHVAYVLILYSISFILYLFVNVLLHLYAVYTWPDDESNGARNNRSVSRSASAVPSPGAAKRISSVAGMNGSANRSARMPRHRTTDSQQLRDAEEFELEGLISDGDEAPSPKEVERLVPSSEHV